MIRERTVYFNLSSQELKLVQLQLSYAELLPVSD